MKTIARAGRGRLMSAIGTNPRLENYVG